MGFYPFFNFFTLSKKNFQCVTTYDGHETGWWAGRGGRVEGGKGSAGAGQGMGRGGGAWHGRTGQGRQGRGCGWVTVAARLLLKGGARKLGAWRPHPNALTMHSQYSLFQNALIMLVLYDLTIQVERNSLVFVIFAKPLPLSGSRFAMTYFH